MADLIPSGSGGILSILHQQSGGIVVPKPFERDIFLVDSYVAGTSYVEEIAERAEKLQAGDCLTLIRESSNKHDELAILVHNVASEKLGYISRQVNPILARLMDAGKYLFAKVTKWTLHNDWYKIDIDIFLRD